MKNIEVISDKENDQRRLFRTLNMLIDKWPKMILTGSLSLQAQQVINRPCGDIDLVCFDEKVFVEILNDDKIVKITTNTSTQDLNNQVYLRILVEGIGVCIFFKDDEKMFRYLYKSTIIAGIEILEPKACVESKSQYIERAVENLKSDINNDSGTLHIDLNNTIPKTMIHLQDLLAIQQWYLNKRDLLTDLF